MSQTSIELANVAAPEKAANPGSLRRPPSTQPSISSELSSNHVQHTVGVESATRTAAIIASVTLITAISTLLNGVTTVALPTMARDLQLGEGLLLWPASIQALTCGCTLLLSGSIADALGPRFTYILGSVLQSGFVLGCGLSKNASDIIIFRGLSGIAISFCLPSAVSIITSSFVGKRRDWAFAAMGGGQPVGFSIGLTLGGVFTDTIGWRWGFYLAAIFNTIVIGVAIWGLPKSLDYPVGTDGRTDWHRKFQQIKHDIDWIGAVIASVSLALLSYVFAAVTGSPLEIHKPENIAMLITAIALIPTFIVWVGRQEKLGRPAIIPNSLWRNKAFTAMCIAVFLTWGSFNAFETILTFYFQEVQLLSATQTSLRFLPEPASGLVSNVAMGFLVHRVRADWLTIGGCLFTLVAPLVMLPAGRYSNYWTTGFLANIFNPIGADSLFTVSNLLITSVFPAKTQGLAGGVFNTISQIGKSVGLALVAVTAASVTRKSSYSDKHSPPALMEGYRSAFWFCFALILATLIISIWGLRNIGKVGHKRD